MTRYVCIHGHFYQPPRFDPWLEEVLPEGSAAPHENWNERICRECYAPLAHARRMEDGAIVSLVNCYEWMSFNFGPTLLTWMERHASEVYSRILAADASSLARLGHGNAMAQAYHHSILPLASDRDKALEIQWAVEDFHARFKREPEGMWLPEAAVDTATLECLARFNMRFVILAPGQAARTGSADSSLRVVDESGLDTSQPYEIALPSGRTIAAFFYHGAVSRAVAFESLLEDGGRFEARLMDGHVGGLRAIATDGESYGHHFVFGEMALAFVLERAASRPDVELINFAAYLEKNPPTRQAELVEPSSWSCIHGIERWRSDCGCSDGGHPQWNQRWRGPLRRALNVLKFAADRHFQKAGAACFRDPDAALAGFGSVLAGSVSFEEHWLEHALPDQVADIRQRDQAAALLQMGRFSLAMFSSCAWFFDDIGRIEPFKAMLAARRVMDLLRETGGPDMIDQVLEHLAQAESNDHVKGTGADLLSGPVAKAAYDEHTAAALAVMLHRLGAEKLRVLPDWPGLKVDLELENHPPGMGRAVLRPRFFSRTREVEYALSEGDALDVVFPGSGRRIRLADLECRKRLLVCSHVAATAQEKVRQCVVGHGLDVDGVFPPFAEGQHTPIGEYGPLLPALALSWAAGGNVQVERDFLAYVSEGLRRSTVMSAIFAGEAQAWALAALEKGDMKRLAGFVRRVNRLGVQVDWWAVQNRAWAMNDHVPGEVLQALGFHPGLKEDA